MKSTSQASVVGSMMCDMVCCRLDLAYEIIIISMFIEYFGQVNWEVLK